MSSHFGKATIKSIAHFQIEGEQKTCQLEAILDGVSDGEKVVLDVSNPELQHFFKVAKKATVGDLSNKALELTLAIKDLDDTTGVTTGSVVAVV